MNYKIKKSNLIIWLFLTIGILFIIIYKNASKIFFYLQNVNLTWLILGILCIVFYWTIEAVTLHFMIKVYDQDFSYWQVLKLVIATQFIHGITPFSSGGQPFQIYILCKHSKLSVSNISSAIVHNFIMYQVILVIMGLYAISFEKIFQLFPVKSVQLKWLAFIGFGVNSLIVIALIVIVVSPKITNWMLSVIYRIIDITPLKRRVPDIKVQLKKNVDGFQKDIRILMRDKKMLINVSALNVVKLLSFYTVAYMICRAVGTNNISVLQSTIASAYVALITSIVPSPGASGGAELGFLIFFTSFVSGSQVNAIMLLWRFITYYFGLIVGLIVFFVGYTCNTKHYERQPLSKFY